MASVSDKRLNPTTQRRMALSYLQEAQINSGKFAPQGLLNVQHLEMKQEADKQGHSPPLNNNTASLFPNLEAAAAASLSMLTSQQLLAAQRTAALFAQTLPVSLQATLAANPSLYHHPQALFGGWPPAVAASPPSPLQHSPLQHSPIQMSPGPVSPANSTKSNSRRNVGIINNNNNVINSSSERAAKKGQATRKRAPKPIKIEPSQQPPVEGGAPLSPPTSVSPEAVKDGRDKVFTCGVCARSFGYKHVLQNHERTHTGEKPFKCPECNKRFTRDHHLKTHMRLHTGEKPYHCSHCDRQFVQVANLRRHLRVHTGERPYACDLCSMKFSDSNQLKAHVLIHKNEKPFSCDHCHMRFRRRHHLMHHKCSTAALAASIAILQQQRHQQELMQPHHQVQHQQQSRPLSRSTIASPSLASDDLEEDIDIDNDVDMGEEEPINHQRVPSRATPIMLMQHRRLPSPVMPLPYNLSALPEQTEPEDLSMPARIRDVHRNHAHSHSSGGSPMSHSPSSDAVHEDDDEELDVSAASPSSLFAPRTAIYKVNFSGNPVQPKSSIGTTTELKAAHAS